MTHEKLAAGRVNDWPQQGVCSTPYVEGDRLYYTSNRATIVSLDTEGFRDGENDGAQGREGVEPEIDGDVVWEYDMIKELDVFPHNLAVSSPLVVDGILYATTGNGVDEGHINIPSPQAPSFIALDAKTGELVWESNLPGEKIFHGTWSNPTYGVIKGRAAGDLPRRRRLDLQPRAEDGQAPLEVQREPAGGEVHPGRPRHRQRDHRHRPWSTRTRSTSGVGQDPEHGEGVGNFWVVDATLDGDVTEKGKVWHRGGNEFHRTISTVAIQDGIVYASDLSGFLYAMDAKTGELYWKHDMLAAVWGSPFVADGRVYLGDEDGDLEVLQRGQDEGGPGHATTWASPSTRRRWPRTASSTCSPATASSRCSRASPGSRRHRGRRARSRRSRRGGTSMAAVATDLAVELREDRPGLLARAAESIASGGLNLDGFAEVEGRLHILTRDPRSARLALETAGLQVCAEEQVVVVQMEDRPGVAARIFRTLAEGGMNVQYTYIASGNRVVIATEDPQKTLELLGA